MKLSKKHVGKLFDVEGGDGSWIYQLVGVSKTELLFYTFSAHAYEIELRNVNNDYRPFKPQAHKKSWVEYGWRIGRRS